MIYHYLCLCVYIYFLIVVVLCCSIMKFVDKLYWGKNEKYMKMRQKYKIIIKKIYLKNMNALY